MDKENRGKGPDIEIIVDEPRESVKLPPNDLVAMNSKNNADDVYDETIKKDSEIENNKGDDDIIIDEKRFREMPYKSTH